MLLISCKKDEVKIPNFEMTGDRNVDLNISSNAKVALEHLAGIHINYETICEVNVIKEYKVGFYFDINNNAKKLIIIEYFSNPCENNEGNINRFSRKYTIPIDKINWLSIDDFGRIFTLENNEYCQLYINMDYNANSITEEFSESRGKKESRTYHSGINKQTSVIIEVPKVFCPKIKHDIEVIMSEFKK